MTFIINVAAGLFWCGTTFLLAPFIADLFNAPQGTNIVRALSAIFFVKYLGNTHYALMRKDLRFKSVAVPEVPPGGAGEFCLSVIRSVVVTGMSSERPISDAFK